MIRPKKFARYALNYVGVVHIFLAAACWRMNGIYNERVYMADDMDQTQFIANGYAIAAAILLASGLIVLLAVKMHRGKHAA
jgi:threonine/homoserine efflux transporter RhtA